MVTQYLDPRLRSPSGVMLASSDSPQGDQVERSPATIARRIPTNSITQSRARSPGSMLWIPATMAGSSAS